MTRLLPWLAPLLLLAFAPSGARAQEPDLERAERLVAQGRYAQARDALGRWLRRGDASSREVPTAQRARALLLRARLAPDFDRAEGRYRAVVRDHPSTPQAAEALLRLGQGFIAAGERERGIESLRRLTADHPEGPYREAALRWLDRVGARVAADDAGDSTASAPADPPGDAARAATDSPRYAVQTGAFRYERGALDLAERLRRTGFEPRFVFVPLNDLLRVRVGRFVVLENAVDLMRRLEDAGFAAIVVGNVAEERPR